MSNFESSVSPQVKLVQEWSQGFQKKDTGLLAKGLHKDYRHIIYPRSLNQPEQTKEQWLRRIAEVISFWTETESTTHSTIEAPGKVIVHFTSKIKTKVEIDGPYEAIIIAHIVTDDDGTLKIKQIEEFVDSKTYLEHMKAFAATGAGQE